MRTLITVAAALALLLSSQAYGQFTINYKLELDGNNHAADYHNGGWIQYTRGSDADITTDRDAGTIFNWAVVVSVTGTDPNSGSLSAGAANLVFDLELHEGTADGPLVDIGLTANPTTTGGFFSTINDGSTDAVRTNAVYAAAFPTVFDVDGKMGNGGTLISSVADGGPNMNFKSYPSTKAFPAGSTAVGGTLVGMGAGYEQLADPAVNRVGVGIVYDPGAFCSTLGVQAVCEGQISSKGFKNGTTYVLVLKAGPGNNVVPADTPEFPICGGMPGKFAIAATNVTTDTISFTMSGSAIQPCTAPVLVSAQSVKTHAIGGDFGVDLMAKETECRDAGLTKIVATFDKPVTVSGTSAVTVSAGSVTSVTASGAVVTVALTGAPNPGQITLAFPGVIAADQAGVCTGGAASTSTLCAAANLGDADNSGTNDLADMLFIRDRLNQTASAANFRGDITLDGKLLLDDMLAVRDNLNKKVTLCP